MSTAEFYDDFLASQIESGINDRIYSLYKKVLKLGLKQNESLLEIGCGIGALTFLLSKKLTKGYIEAFDPSEKSVEFAKQKIKKKNVYFSTGDIVTYEPKHAFSFDKIILFDVLEHIPIEQHLAVFNKAESLLKKDALLLINLPNPAYILYDQANQPEVLQELDQPVFLLQLLPKLEEVGLELVRFETHSVWVKDDYHFLIVRKKQEFKEEFLQAKRNVLQKAARKLLGQWRKINHRFS